MPSVALKKFNYPYYFNSIILTTLMSGRFPVELEVSFDESSVTSIIGVDAVWDIFRSLVENRLVISSLVETTLVISSLVEKRLVISSLVENRLVVSSLVENRLVISSLV